jgi:hypothetical protein
MFPNEHNVRYMIGEAVENIRCEPLSALGDNHTQTRLYEGSSGEVNRIDTFSDDGEATFQQRAFERITVLHIRNA